MELISIYTIQKPSLDVVLKQALRVSSFAIAYFGTPHEISPDPNCVPSHLEEHLRRISWRALGPEPARDAFPPLARAVEATNAAFLPHWKHFYSLFIYEEIPTWLSCDGHGPGRVSIPRHSACPPVLLPAQTLGHRSIAPVPAPTLSLCREHHDMIQFHSDDIPSYQELVDRLSDMAITAIGEVSRRWNEGGGVAWWPRPLPQHRSVPERVRTPPFGGGGPRMD